MREHSTSISQGIYRILNWKIKITAPLQTSLQLFYYFPHVFVSLHTYCAPPLCSHAWPWWVPWHALNSAKQLKVKCFRASRFKRQFLTKHEVYSLVLAHFTNWLISTLKHPSKHSYQMKQFDTSKMVLGNKKLILKGNASLSYRVDSTDSCRLLQTFPWKSCFHWPLNFWILGVILLSHVVPVTKPDEVHLSSWLHNVFNESILQYNID